MTAELVPHENGSRAHRLGLADTTARPVPNPEDWVSAAPASTPLSQYVGAQLETSPDRVTGLGEARSNMRTAVVGLGKIGLPLAVQFAAAGHQVVGVDVQQRVVDLVNAGTEPFPGEAHLQETLNDLVPAGRLTATTDYGEGVRGADAVVVVVPLFVDEASGEPDFDWMDSATRSLAEHLSPGTLVSYETTLPVGTTRGRWKPMIEEVSGLVEGRDFHVVFSPERVFTGRVFQDLRRYPKLIGGLSDEGARLAMNFSQSALTS